MSCICICMCIYIYIYILYICMTSSCCSPSPSHNISQVSYHVSRRATEYRRKTRPTTPTGSDRGTPSAADPQTKNLEFQVP